MRLLIILSITLFIYINLIGQQNPPSQSWKKIETKNFKIIFPDDIKSSAQKIANTLEWVYKFDNKTLKSDIKPLSVILYNQSTISNAYASLMPRKMSLYLTPFQNVINIGSSDWLQSIAIHEYRHIAQYQKNKQHFTKFATYIFGDFGQSMLRWSIPYWFFEGDAVCLETALTNGGRGRIPEFSMGIRNYLLENEKFTYDQAYLGSYKRFYPNHYNLGYQLSAYARIKYGADIWDKVLERTNKYSFWPFAFNRSIKKYTGHNINEFYKATMNDLKEEWTLQDKKVIPSDFKLINSSNKRTWTNYSNPQYDESGNIICRKNSLDKTTAIYILKPDGTEKKIKYTDASTFNYSNGKIVWSRFIHDIRWGEKVFSDIIIYDLKSRKETKISKKAKYFSPALSPDASKIAAIKHLPNQKTFLTIIDANSSEESLNIQVGNNDFIRTPRWSKDGNSIVFTHAKYNGSAVSIFDIKAKEIKEILPKSTENIGNPIFYKDYIIYNSPYSGIGDIYAVKISSKEKFRITSSKYGAYNPNLSYDLNKLTYQNYNKSGYDIVEVDINTNNWEKIKDIETSYHSYPRILTSQEAGSSIFEKAIPENEYEITKYKKIKDAVKLHSWGVFPNLTYIDFGFLSNNYLNTLSISGGYLYNTNEKTHGAYLGLSYSKYYPIFSLVSQFNQRINSYPLNDGSTYIDEWDEYSVKSGLSIPFNLSRGIYNTTISIGAGAQNIFIKGKDQIRYLSETYDGNFTPLYGNFSINHLRKKALRDFNPMYGQTLNVSYKHIMDYDNYEGYIFSSSANLYFPGVLPHNSLKLGGGYEKQLTYHSTYNNLYYFSSQILFPRGYSSVRTDEFFRFSADYQFPLWYPDISIGPLAYIKRIKLGAFFDYADSYLGNDLTNYQSIGGNFSFKLNFLRIKHDFDIGLQYAYRLNDGKYHISLLLVGLPF